MKFPRHFAAFLLLSLLFCSLAFAQNNLHDFTSAAIGGAQSTKLLVSTGVALIGTTPTQIPSAVLTLTASATNYIYVDTVAGTISFNTSGFTATDYPVATAVTDSIHITSLTDDRWGAYAAAGSSTGGTVTSATIAGTSGQLNVAGTCTITTTGTCTISIPSSFYTNASFFPFQSITTTGTSGAATLSGGVLNIPQYPGSGLSGMTATQIPVAATASTITSSIATTNPTYFPFQSLTTTGSNCAGATLATGALNIPPCTGGGSLPSGSQGNEIINTSSGTGTTHSDVANTIHSAAFTGGTDLATILAACPSSPTPCHVVLDPSATAIPTTGATIGSTTQEVAVIDEGVALECTGTSGANCISEGEWGSLVCDRKGPAATPSGCTIYTSSSANITSMFTNVDHTGAQNDVVLKGFNFKPAAAATIINAAIWLVAVEGKGQIEDNSVLGIVGTNSSCNGEPAATFCDLSIEDGPSTGAFNNLTFKNNAFYGQGLAGNVSINIVSALSGGTGSGSVLTFLGTNVGDGLGGTGCISGVGCMINIDGSTGLAGSCTTTCHFVQSILFDGLYAESTTGQTGNFIEVRNCRGCVFNSVSFNGGPALTTGLSITESAAGRNGRIHINGFLNGSRATNIVNNAVTGYASGNAQPDFDYTDPGDSSLSIGTYNDGPMTINGLATFPGSTSGSATIGASATTSLLDLNGTNATVSTGGALTVSSCTGCGSGGPGTGTQYTHPYWSTTSALGSVAPTTGYDGVPQVETNSTTAGAFTAAPVSAPQGVVPNAQTGTTYTYLLTDRAKYVSFSNASPIAVTLPQAGSSGFGVNFVNVSCDIGAGTATITPTTSTISYSTGSAYTSAASTMALTTGQCAWIVSDNTNYFAIKSSGGSGGDTITSPNSTLAIGGTATNTTLDLEGSAGEIMAGATPALTYTPTLGKSGTAGTLAMFPASGNFTTTLGSSATASNTFVFPATVFTTGHLGYCATSSTTCTWTDAGYSYNALPLADHATQTANTLVANVTGSTAAPTAAAIPAGVQFYTAGTGYSAATAAQLGTVLNIASGLVLYSGGTAAAPVGSTDWSASATTLTSAAAGTLNMSASTGAPSIQLPAVVGGTILAGTSTANLSAPVVIQNTNSSNNNTSITMGVSSPGTSTGQTTLNVNCATTQGNCLEAGTGGTWTAGVLSGQTKVFQVLPTGQTTLGTGPTVAGSPTSAFIIGTTGTCPTAQASAGFLCPSSSSDNTYYWNVNNASVNQHLPQTAITSGSAYTNATTSFTSVAGGSGQTLAFTVAASTNYVVTCNILWQGSAGTTGPKFQWTGPASPTAVTASMHSPVTTATYLDATATAFSSPMADTGTITTATNFNAVVTLGLVNGTTGGTVTLQAAANGTGTLTIQPGSFCEFQ